MREGESVYERKSIAILSFMVVPIFLSSSFFNVRADLDGTTGTSIYEAAQYNFANGEFASGFVRFAAGFKAPAGGTAFVGVHEPVSGIIDLNGGTIELTDNLILAPGAQILGDAVGAIHLNGYTLSFNSALALDGQVNIYATPTGTIDGQGNRIVFKDPSDILFSDRDIPGDHMTYSNIAFSNLDTFSFRPPGSSTPSALPHTQQATLYNVVFNARSVPSPLNIITIYSDILRIRGLVILNVTEPGVTYQVLGSDGQMIIDSGATLFMGPSCQFVYAGKDPVFADHSARWYFNNSSMSIFEPTSQSRVFKKGSLVIDGKVQWNMYPSLAGIVLGDGTKANEPNLEILSNAILEIVPFIPSSPQFTFTTMQLIYNGVN